MGERHPYTGRFLAFDCEIDCQTVCAGLCGADSNPLTTDWVYTELDGTPLIPVPPTTP